MNRADLETAVKARFEDIDNVDVEVEEFYSEHNNEDRYRIAVKTNGIRTTYEIAIHEPDQYMENTIDAIDSAVRNVQ